MFSKSCEYGIRATIFVAGESSKGRKPGIREIASEIDSPEAFTGKILQKLVKHQIITSSKGPSGGFFIPEESLSHIKLMEIVMAMDGDAVFKNCALGLGGCSCDSPCPLHQEIKRICNELEAMLRSVSIEDLSLRFQSKQTFLKR